MRELGNARFDAAIVFFAEQVANAKQYEGVFDVQSFWQNPESIQVIGSFDHLDIETCFGFASVDDLAIVYAGGLHGFEALDVRGELHTNNGPAPSRSRPDASI